MADFKTIEFTDIKRNDYIDLSDVSVYGRHFVVAEHRARWRLRQLLKANGVQHPYDQIYFTTPAVDGVIIFSKSLVEIVTDAVVDSSRESTQLGAGGAFYSAANDTRTEANLNLPVDLISAVMAFVYDDIKISEARCGC